MDIEVNIVFNKDNSGTYNSFMDLAKMFAMMNQMGGESNNPKNRIQMDSTILLNSLVMATDNLTEQEKELYRNASLRVKVENEHAVAKVYSVCSFSSPGQLQEIANNFSIVLQTLRAFDQLVEKGCRQNRPDEQIAENIIPPAGVFFDFQPKKWSIRNLIIDTKGIENYLNNDSAITALKGMVPMMVDMMNRTTISTAGKIKKYSGNNAGLSDDKKTVTFQYSFTDILEHPEKMAFSRQVQVID